MNASIVIQDLHAGYGDSVVLQGIDLKIDQGTCTALLGRNGMGKTTLLNTIMGLTKVHSGTIKFSDQVLTKLAPHQRSRLGIAWVPQERGVFAPLTVEQNLQVVQNKNNQDGKWNLKSIYDFFPRLKQRRNNLGNQLSGGEQQMLSIGRALITNPRVLLLDEPLEGLAPVIANDLLLSIEELAESSGITIIIIEQHPKKLLPITQQAVILERGTIVYKGNSEELINDDATLQQWLGV